MRYGFWVKSSIFLLIAALCCMTFGCAAKKKVYRVGLDPSSYPLELMGKQSNVFAFNNELLQKIAQDEKIEFQRINMSWDNLAMGLRDGKYEAMLSPLYPYPYNLEKYSFSDLYLKTGPVLVVRSDMDIKKTDMAGMEVAILSLQDEAFLIKRYPGVVVRYYGQISPALNDLINDVVDGVFAPLIPARTFIDDLYQGKVKIATSPLNEAGLRMVTMKGQNEELIKTFNDALDEMREEGTFQKLLKKWNLGLVKD